jgi:SOUL heme-binding protein
MKPLTALAAAAFTALSTSVGLSAEEPKYTLVKEEKPFSIRDYPPLLLAEVTVGGARGEATNAAFRILAGFIFGKNVTPEGGAGKIEMTAPVTQSAKIAMTAPVTQTGKGGEWVVAFIMPSKYSSATLPKPTDPRITIRKIAAKRMAVVTFSGNAKDKDFAKQRAALEGFITTQKLKILGAPQFAYYDPPFKPGFLRRNEVMIPVR